MWSFPFLLGLHLWRRRFTNMHTSKFIRHVGLSFCCLYDRGFSSLGGMTNTRPNPALALDAEAKTFRPAYELIRDDEERLGRDR